MYIRFVISERNESSHQEKGIFSAVGDLRDDNELYAYEKEIDERTYKWFNSNLAVPNVQASDSNHYAKPRAISWFKDTAIKHIEHMREFVHILEAHDVRVKQLNTDRPGKIVYEDQHQIAAIPFKDTFS